MRRNGTQGSLALIGLVGLAFSGAGCGGGHARPQVRAGAKGPATPAAATAGRRSLPAGAAAVFDASHSVNVVTADGAVVVLENGAVYAVRARDQRRVAAWAAGARVAVAAGDDALTEVINGVTAAVTPAGDSFLGDPYSSARAHAKHTSSRDGRLVVLSDGSIWVVADPGDRAKVSAWSDGAPIVAVDAAPRRGYVLLNAAYPSAIHASYVGYE